MTDTRRPQEQSSSITLFYFISAESGRVMRPQQIDASDGSFVVVGPASGEPHNRWRIEPATDGVSDRWLLSNEASNGSTVLSVGPRNQLGDYLVRLENRSKAPAANQLWFFEHYSPTPIRPRSAPMLPATVRLWCMPHDGKPVILTFEPNWHIEPFLVARRSDPDNGAPSHWLPIMTSGSTPP